MFWLMYVFAIVVSYFLLRALRKLDYKINNNKFDEDTQVFFVYILFFFLLFIPIVNLALVILLSILLIIRVIQTTAVPFGVILDKIFFIKKN